MFTIQSLPTWFKSRRCEGGACVEAARVDGGMAMRDSKNPDGPMLNFSMNEWNAFMAGIRSGDFELN